MVRGSFTNSIMYHSNPNKIQHRQHDSNIMRQHQHNTRTQQWERHQHHSRATAGTARHQHHLHDEQTSAACTNTSTKFEAPASTPCTSTMHGPNSGNDTNTMHEQQRARHDTNTTCTMHKPQSSCTNLTHRAQTPAPKSRPHCQHHAPTPALRTKFNADTRHDTNTTCTMHKPRR